MPIEILIKKDVNSILGGGLCQVEFMLERMQSERLLEGPISSTAIAGEENFLANIFHGAGRGRGVSIQIRKVGKTMENAGSKCANTGRKIFLRFYEIWVQNQIACLLRELTTIWDIFVQNAVLLMGIVAGLLLVSKSKTKDIKSFMTSEASV